MATAWESDEWRPTHGSVSKCITEALAAADRGADAEVRVPVVLAARIHGWGVIAHRLSVAGRALVLDHGPPGVGGPAPVEVADAVALVEWAEPFEHRAAVGHLADWAARTPPRRDCSDAEVWPMLVAVDYLRRRLGYPPHIVA